MPRISTTQTSSGLLDVLIRAGLIAVLVISCYQVFKPFVALLLWAIILAVAFYPLQRKLMPVLGGRDGLTATLIVLVAIAVLLAPIYLLADSTAASIQALMASAQGGDLHFPPPAQSVADWPIIGKPLHALWQQAADDLGSVSQRFAPQLKSVAVGILSKVAGFGVGLLLFIVALILAAIFMAYGEHGRRSAIRAAARIVGADRAQHIVELCTATIRAVAQGVIGIAVVQMLLVTLGFVAMGVPGAGLLALAVLFLGIIQVPATLVTVPVIIYVIATHGVSAGTIVFSVYVFVAGLVDNVLKPLLLGRGVDVPMPVVLIGALGGMVTGGLLGLFIGPVLLALGYELFWQWVDAPAQDLKEQAAQPS